MFSIETFFIPFPVSGFGWFQRLGRQAFVYEVLFSFSNSYFLIPMSKVSQQKTQSADFYWEKVIVLKQLGFHLCIGTKLVRWCPVNANGSQIHFSVWEVTDFLHKGLRLTFFLCGGIFEKEHFIFVFRSGILMSQKRPIYFNSWHTSKTTTKRFQFSLLQIFIKVSFEGFFVNRKPTIWRKLAFVENQGFRFLKLFQKRDRTKFRKKSYLHQRISVFNAFFSKKRLWTRPSKSDSKM